MRWAHPLALLVLALGCSRRGSPVGARADAGPDPTAADAGSTAAGKPIDRDRDYPDRTEVVYLSGLGTDDAVPWSFTINAGRRAGEAATIPVPSNWELHGFGTFHYGLDTRSTEQGTYRRSFDLPAAWAGRKVFLVFEGAMTDTAVTVNGQSAGPAHQGAFYRFKYDVTTLVEAGAANQIEVTVSNESAEPSVNDAERGADYWIFGGIFRPVYLEAVPSPSIERFAVDARADGSLRVDVFLRDLSEPAQVTARVLDEDLAPVGSTLLAAAEAGQTQVTLSGAFSGIEPWSAETPRRYRLAVELAAAGGARHAIRENFGFRTVEVRPGDGVYVNGRRVRLHGLNRHSFWPESGRALSPRITTADVQLLKSLNANAVRCSHYPPDRHFLDAADSYGLYVLDELAGWQSPPYATPVGRRLIEEMVTFDANHPSILFWDNGNEGGWNTALDGDFARWDPQRRPVLHPFATFSNINTAHYQSYAAVTRILAGSTLFMPTEFLHGLYDGGAGAGLEDYWNAIRKSPRGAGGFIWALLDEGVLRADRGGQIDTRGNLAPDGVVGPYRQKEGSSDTIRQIWSPVQIALPRLPDDFDKTLPVENTYDFSDLDTVSFSWKLVRFDLRAGAGQPVAEGTARTGSIPPGGSGALSLPLPADWREAHALQLDATDRSGTLIGRWSWMIASPSALRQQIVPATSEHPASAVDAGGTVAVTAAGTTFTFERASGRLASVEADGRGFCLGNGPLLSAGSATLTAFTAAPEGNDYLLTATYSGDLQEVRWRVLGNGWLDLRYRYAPAGSQPFFGVDFDCPEARVQSAAWLGRGPFRVWKNRLQGPWHDLWQRDRNDAITGQRWDYPEWKGYFADVRWARLRTTEGPITFAVESEGLYLRLYTAANGSNPANAGMTFPAHDLSFLHAIPAIGDKFLPADQLGPQGAPNTPEGPYEGHVYMRFGDAP